MEKNKYKICVYAICKNEEKFVNDWYNSMKEADEIYVLDTGSSDKTVDKLKKLGVNVKTEVITPWRFDTARNKSLEMVPEDTDICVCTDFDERFNPGWRIELEKIWREKVNQVKYNYNWSFNENGTPAVNFYLDKIHDRHNYYWKNAVHEVVINKNNNGNIIYCDDITLNHYPDHTKPRTSYLPLLKLSVKEDPENDRNMHYLGREYMYYKKWNKCIDTLIKHLNLKSATWDLERSASMRFIGRSYIALKRYDEAKMWFNKAINETPNLREPYMEMAFLMYQLKDYKELEKYINKLLSINTHNKVYINEPCCYNEIPYELLSISYYYQNRIEEAIATMEKAIKINDKNERLKNNIEIMKNNLNKNL